MAEELIAAFPDAKIILTERDENSWFESYDATVGKSWRFWNSRRWFFWVPPRGREYDFHVLRMWLLMRVEGMRGKGRRNGI
ncbi:uncharacterized protein MYCFIDRAFT_132019 [Pseudocercospora fijiensis CIRAD86]|uniref:Uncharacterized protein n=1 Tax=Pseudocercospora fijiensis (strain CIRAD86) TaxID=383855 RepID=M3B8P0_PSEFD|nr:uncharacterized protein MYCFIDRAFT_132019 [Pseudocercospora fijiensis CIRAD86]EME85692.1 hypothetical protein MYCFIDRAFT_132019 [Pseudocercospora fijiensis CIRAD86]